MKKKRKHLKNKRKIIKVARIIKEEIIEKTNQVILHIKVMEKIITSLRKEEGI